MADLDILVGAGITANTAASAVFVLADCLKRQSLLDATAISHLLELLDEAIADLPDDSQHARLHRAWRRRLAP